MKRIFLQTIMAAAVLLSACNRNENPAGAGLVDGEEVETINVTVGEPESNTRVGVDVDDANKVDKYHWIAGDKIWLLEVNAAGDAFTGQRYEYTYLAASDPKNGTFKGRGAITGRRYIPVHVRKSDLVIWPSAGEKYMKFNMPEFDQKGPWSDKTVQQSFADILLFVGSDFAMVKQPGALIILKHMLLQIELDLQAENLTIDKDKKLNRVSIYSVDGPYHASQLAIGVTGKVDENACTWGREGVVMLNEVAIGSGYTARLVLYQKTREDKDGYGNPIPVYTQIKVTREGDVYGETTAYPKGKLLEVGKVYKSKNLLSFFTRITISYEIERDARYLGTMGQFEGNQGSNGWTQEEAYKYTKTFTSTEILSGTKIIDSPGRLDWTQRPPLPQYVTTTGVVKYTYLGAFVREGTRKLFSGWKDKKTGVIYQPLSTYKTLVSLDLVAEWEDAPVSQGYILSPVFQVAILKNNPTNICQAYYGPNWSLVQESAIYETFTTSYYPSFASNQTGMVFYYYGSYRYVGSLDVNRLMFREQYAANTWRYYLVDKDTGRFTMNNYGDNQYDYYSQYMLCKRAGGVFGR